MTFVNVYLILVFSVCQRMKLCPQPQRQDIARPSPCQNIVQSYNLSREMILTCPPFYKVSCECRRHVLSVWEIKIKSRKIWSKSLIDQQTYVVTRHFILFRARRQILTVSTSLTNIPSKDWTHRKDLLTKGLTVSFYIESAFWHGPRFMIIMYVKVERYSFVGQYYLPNLPESTYFVNLI